jgi:hypothetical protein
VTPGLASRIRYNVSMSQRCNGAIFRQWLMHQLTNLLEPSSVGCFMSPPVHKALWHVAA